MRRSWLVALLPAGLGVAAVVVTSAGWLGNPIIYLRADIGTLSLLTGLFLAVGMSICLLREMRRDKGQQLLLADTRAQAAEDRRRFLRRLDHELKNPITAIRAGLANVANGSATDAQREAMASVEVQVLRLSRLTSDLRKLAELETRPLERVAVNVAELLREAVALAQEQPGAEARILTLTLPRAPWPLPAIPGDWDLVLLAVYNLLNNALKFTQPGDNVEVRAFDEGAYVSIEVADTGPGIPEEELPHVGEELYRGQGARGVPGSGLGMALVHAIVERHGGKVALRSRAGQGTVVTVRFPVG